MGIEGGWRCEADLEDIKKTISGVKTPKFREGLQFLIFTKKVRDFDL